MPQIVDVKGIDADSGAKLAAAGVNTSNALLARGAKARGRRELAHATGIGEKLILTWVNRVDLARLKGIGPEFADLLEAAGVDSAAELAKRVPDHLSTTLHVTNESKHLVRRMPTKSEVEHWITEARQTPKVVEH